MHFLLPAQKVHNNVKAAEAVVTYLMSWKDKTMCLNTELHSLHRVVHLGGGSRKRKNCFPPLKIHKKVLRCLVFHHLSFSTVLLSEFYTLYPSLSCNTSYKAGSKLQGNNWALIQGCSRVVGHIFRGVTGVWYECITIPLSGCCTLCPVQHTKPSLLFNLFRVKGSALKRPKYNLFYVVISQDHQGLLT